MCSTHTSSAGQPGTPRSPSATGEARVEPLMCKSPRHHGAGRVESQCPAQPVVRRPSPRGGRGQCGATATDRARYEQGGVEHDLRWARTGSSPLERFQARRRATYRRKRAGPGYLEDGFAEQRVGACSPGRGAAMAKTREVVEREHMRPGRSPDSERGRQAGRTSTAPTPNFPKAARSHRPNLNAHTRQMAPKRSATTSSRRPPPLLEKEGISST